MFGQHRARPSSAFSGFESAGSTFVSSIRHVARKLESRCWLLIIHIQGLELLSVGWHVAWSVSRHQKPKGHHSAGSRVFCSTTLANSSFRHSSLCRRSRKAIRSFFPTALRHSFSTNPRSFLPKLSTSIKAFPQLIVFLCSDFWNRHFASSF